MEKVYCLDNKYRNNTKDENQAHKDLEEFSLKSSTLMSRRARKKPR